VSHRAPRASFRILRNLGHVLTFALLGCQD
jgi:hypothetical protein